MRRADRLFQLVEHLRRRRTAVTGTQLAALVGTSLRTVYRDIRDLISRGVPIEGEAGVGYRLRGYDLPPIAFGEDEIEALVLGARIVGSWGDPQLASAARAALAKIETSLPPDRRDQIEATALYAPDEPSQAPITIDLAVLRRALRESRKVRVRYVNGKGEGSERTLRPLALTFFGPIWMVPAWCELRRDFRVFRPDRMQALEILDETFGEEPGFGLHDFLANIARKRSA